MNDLNKILITGNLTHNPEIRYTPSGVKTANLRIAIHRRFKIPNSQEKKEETEFITAVVWEKLAENCVQYLKKGSKIFVEGRIQTRKYIDSHQVNQSVVEIRADSIEFLESNRENTDSYDNEAKDNKIIKED
jgi:single-strand DNA-binding protein